MEHEYIHQNSVKYSIHGVRFNFNKRISLMKSSHYFLVAAFASFVLSVGIWFLGDQSVAKDQGIFVGLWVPSILGLGQYFKDDE